MAGSDSSRSVARTWRIDEFYITATSPRVTAETLVLKHRETFAVFDEHGNIGVGHAPSQGYDGIYHEGTRFLCHEEIFLNGQSPLLLSSAVSSEGSTVIVDLTNPDIYKDGALVLPHGTVHISRQKVLWDAVCYQSLRLSNFGRHPIEIAINFDFAADFSDIFEVRGIKREARGKLRTPKVEKSNIEYSYLGLDGMERKTTVSWNIEAESVSDKGPLFYLAMRPREEVNLEITVACETRTKPTVSVFDQARTKLRSQLKELSADDAEIETSNEQFNAWIHRSLADVHSLTSNLPTGPYPYAGIPWFSAPFGRDGCITAYQLLMVNPSLARGALGYLAATQASEEDEFSQAEPGKIIHEERMGEMSELGEVPFRRYYGSIDSTLLFIWLAEQYLRHTDDIAFIERIWDNIKAAAEWIDKYGDRDGDGWVEYEGHKGNGLENQGWKDSKDAVFHADGRIPEGPIALVEVQAYQYAARQGVAWIAERLKENDFARSQRQAASQLRRQFDETFWCEEIGTYALALDGRKRQCQARTSNAGHVLLAGLADRRRAETVVRSLMGPDFFTGWGVRTVARGETLFNPIAYHNGSVWPHDNSLIAQGMAIYGFKAEVLRITTAMFDAVTHFGHMRMPELFCGFDRVVEEEPVLYPVACNPQAWAAGSVFLFLRACLGLRVDGSAGRLIFERPTLPPIIERVKISGLRCGGSSATLLFSRYQDDVGVNVLRRDGPLEVVVIK